MFGLDEGENGGSGRSDYQSKSAQNVRTGKTFISGKSPCSPEGNVAPPANSLLQPCLTQGIRDPIRFRLILVWKHLGEGIQRELRINPEDFRSFSKGVLFPAHHTVGSRQTNVGSNVIGRKLE